MSGLTATKNLSLMCPLNAPALFEACGQPSGPYISCMTKQSFSQPKTWLQQSENFLEGQCSQGLLGSYTPVYYLSVWAAAITKYLRLGIL